MTSIKRRIGTALVAAALGATSLVALATPAHAGNLGYALTRDGFLNQGDYIQRSTNAGIVRLALQGDGNLVLSLINPNTGAQIKACWGAATNYDPYSGIRAIYQTDGNFVVYNEWGAIWASNTVGHAGETVDMNWQGVLYVGYTPITGPCK